MNSFAWWQVLLEMAIQMVTTCRFGRFILSKTKKYLILV
jgi:hypothetical protein